MAPRPVWCPQFDILRGERREVPEVRPTIAYLVNLEEAARASQAARAAAKAQPGPSQGPVRAQPGPSQAPGRAQPRPSQGSATPQPGPSQGPARAQPGPSQGPARAEPGPSQGPAASQPRPSQGARHVRKRPAAPASEAQPQAVKRSRSDEEPLYSLTAEAQRNREKQRPDRSPGLTSSGSD